MSFFRDVRIIIHNWRHSRYTGTGTWGKLHHEQRPAPGKRRFRG